MRSTFHKQRAGRSHPLNSWDECDRRTADKIKRLIEIMYRQK
ncbi:hypothetical protein [Calothrix rhizosoleniae]|nr:hypothetical protein [Calothrix rhizosoleniae]